MPTHDNIQIVKEMVCSQEWQIGTHEIPTEIAQYSIGVYIVCYTVPFIAQLMIAYAFQDLHLREDVLNIARTDIFHFSENGYIRSNGYVTQNRLYANVTLFMMSEWLFFPP